MIPIPPIAWKTFGVGAVLAIAFGVGYSKGRDGKQKEWDASIAKQAQQTVSQMMAEAEMASDVIKRSGEQQRKTKEVAKTKREVIRVYVQSPAPKCELSAEFVRHYDGTSRLFDPTDLSLSAGHESAGGAAELPDEGVSDAEVLQAHQDEAEYAAGLRNAYDALVQFEQGRYIIQQAAQGGEP